MIVRSDGIEFTICPGLELIVCKLFEYCDKWNLPLVVNRSCEDELEFSTLGWTEQLIYKYQHETKRDYSYLTLENVIFCNIMENSIKITVDINIKLRTIHGTQKHT